MQNKTYAIVALAFFALMILLEWLLRRWTGSWAPRQVPGDRIVAGFTPPIPRDPGQRWRRRLIVAAVVIVCGAMGAAIALG